MACAQGQCRLLGDEKGQLATLVRMGPGSFIGLASLLRAEACETVTASTELIAAAIPDHLVVELYKQEPSFRSWCNQQLWPAELAALLEKMLSTSAVSDRSLRNKLAPLMQQATLLSQKAWNDPKALKDAAEGRSLFLASANTSEAIGRTINPDQPLPSAKPPFALRVISLPQTLPWGGELNHQTDTTAFSTQSAPLLPSRSDLQLGQVDPMAGFQPIRAKVLWRKHSPVSRSCGADETALSQGLIEKKGQPSAWPRTKHPVVRPARCRPHAAPKCLHQLALVFRRPMQWDGSAVASHSKGLLIASTRHGEIQLTAEELEQAFPEGIELLLMERAVNTPEQRFGPSWFLPALTRYRGVLTQVLVASFVVQLFGLANPLLIQVIIDKVISQRSLDTLQVLGIGLVLVTLLEGVLGSIRTFLFTETTNSIDQRLGAEVIDHLLRLPLGYFDRRPVGELGTRIAELEKIRTLLTGYPTTLLDAVSLIYIVVMAMYSWV